MSNLRHQSPEFDRNPLLHAEVSFGQKQLKALFTTSFIYSVALLLSSANPGAAMPVSSAATSNSPTQNQPDAATKAKVLQTYAKLPLSFEANQGQTDKEVKFLTRGNGYSVFLTPTEAVLSLRHTPKQASAAKASAKSQTNILRLQLVGSNPSTQVKGLQQLPGKSNYLTSKDSSKWHTNIAQYAKVQYQAVYPGIDLVYYGNQGRLEYDFNVAPGAKPENIKFRVAGAERLSVDKQGNLLLHTQNGVLRQHQPKIYQEINKEKKAIAGSYVLLGKQEVGFKVAAYDRTQPLTIDPVLSYSTYLGGSGSETGTGIAVDVQGNIYVVGSTGSTDFPTKNTFGSTNGDGGTFVTKLNPSASGDTSFVYSTYLNNGGGAGIAVDAQGNAYITGITYSNDFPTTENALSRSLGGYSDAFVTKLSASGDRLLYSTYLGGRTASSSASSSADFGNAIALDGRGNIYVTGETYSSDFPTTNNAFNRTFGGSLNDIFVTKLNPNASGQASLLYSTYLGGNGFESGFGIAVDFLGNAYVTGLTYSSNFPLKNAFDTTFVGAVNDSEAFVTKLNLNASGETSLLYSSYLGGSGGEVGRAIAVDVRGNAYVTGRTQSNDFPTKNALSSSLQGSQDAFVTKVNPDRAVSLVYSTYLGGISTIYADTDEGYGIAVDPQGNAYVAGTTSSNNFPLQNAFDSNLSGLSDSFVTKLNAAGNSVVYSSYLGGNNFDNVSGIAVDVRGNAYVTGSTYSSDFPTKNAFDSSFFGSTDAFVTKISP